MAKRGRPPKKKNLVAHPPQQKITMHWKTQQAVEKEAARRRQAGPRTFKTDAIVLPIIPKFELMPQVPLYHKAGHTVEGKVPLEEWSTPELANFREKIVALQTNMKNTLDVVINEIQHVAKIKKEGLKEDIPVITQAEYANGGEVERPRVKHVSPVYVSPEKFKIPSANDKPRKKMTEHTKVPRRETSKEDFEPQHSEEISLPKPIYNDFIVPDVIEEEIESGKSKRGRSSSMRKRKTPDSKRSDKKRRKKKRKIDLDSESDEELAAKPVANAPPSVTSANFWSTMEPHIAPLNPVDLKCLQPVDIPSEDEIVIPPLGKHYSLIMQDNPETKEKQDTNDISCGDLTQRLLASLIETQTCMDISEDTALYSNTCLPLDVPPTADYHPNKMSMLEDRIRIELRCIGLLDQDMTLSRREDDEICSEIRLLQKQLKERIESNNAKRIMFYEMASQKMAADKSTFLRGAENRAVELIYDRKQAKHRGRRRSKGRPRGRPPSTPATPVIPTTPISSTAAPVPFASTPTKEPRSHHLSKAPVRKEPAVPQAMEMG